MPNISNEKYRKFLDKGIIEPITKEQFKDLLKKVKSKKYLIEARSLIIALYYTGARPAEIFKLRGRDFKKESTYIRVFMPAAKNGLPRPIFLRHTNPDIKELWNFRNKCHPDILLFRHFKSQYKRTAESKKGTKVYDESSAKLRYHFKKWFGEEITPYYFRHSRFSDLIQKGASSEDIMQIKGSKTLQSVRPYMHLSSKTGKKLARKIS